MRVPTSEKESSLDDDSNWTDHIEPPIPPIDNEDKLDTLFLYYIFLKILLLFLFLFLTFYFL